MNKEKFKIWVSPYGHSSVFVSKSKVYVLGKNDKYQLGLDHNIGVVQPFENKNIKNLKYASLGAKHTIFHTKHGLFSCGMNKNGELLRELTFHTIKPCIVVDYTDVLWVKCGFFCTYVKTKSGTILVFGLRMPTCQKVNFFNEVIRVECFVGHNVFLCKDGSIFTTGKIEHKYVSFNNNLFFSGKHVKSTTILRKGYCWGGGINKIKIVRYPKLYHMFKIVNMWNYFTDSFPITKDRYSKELDCILKHPKAQLLPNKNLFFCLVKTRGYYIFRRPYRNNIHEEFVMDKSICQIINAQRYALLIDDKSNVRVFNNVVYEFTEWKFPKLDLADENYHDKKERLDFLLRTYNILCLI